MSKREAPTDAPKGMKLRHAVRLESTWSWSYICKIAWSPDGHLIALPTRGGAIHLLDAETGKLVNCLNAKAGPVWGVAWLPDSHQLLSGGDDGKITVWDTRTGAVRAEMGEGGPTVGCMALSPDGRRLASTRLRAKTQLWEVTRGRLIATLDPQPNSPSGLAWSPDGSKLALEETVQGMVPSWKKPNTVISGEGTIKIWDSDTGGMEAELRQESPPIWCIAWSPDGHTLASGCLEGMVRLWDPALVMQKNALVGHSRGVHGLSFSADGALLASCSWDNTVRVWRTDTWEPVFTHRVMRREVCAEAVRQFVSDETAPPALAFHPSAPVLATVGDLDSEVRIWDLDLHELLPPRPTRRAEQVGLTKPAAHAHTPLRVFLCHASEDKEKVRKICRKLKSEPGIEPWLDKRELRAGDEWRGAIERAISQSGAVVVFLSHAAVAKRSFFLTELCMALSAAERQPNAGPVPIPVRLEDCEVPEQLGRWQYVDLFRRGGYENLRRALLDRAARRIDLTQRPVG